MTDYKQKYLKYKQKYLLAKQMGGIKNEKKYEDKKQEANSKEEKEALIKSMKKSGPRPKKCTLNKKCTEEYLACIPKKTNKNKPYTYYESQNLWSCRDSVLTKYFPPKKQRLFNPKRWECKKKCPFSGKKIKNPENIKKKKECEKKCNKDNPKWIILQHGKVVNNK